MGGAAFCDTHHRCTQMMGIAKSCSTHPTSRRMLVRYGAGDNGYRKKPLHPSYKPRSCITVCGIYASNSTPMLVFHFQYCEI
jgi:hypothetical protein